MTEPPEWLESLVDSVADCIEATAPSGPHLTVEGVHQGHSVWLRVLSKPPEDEEPDLKLEVGPKPE